MPWGAVAGGLASAVAGHVLNGGGGGGGGGGTSGGSAPPVYVPKDQAGADQNFLDNKGQYQANVQDQYNTTNPYNQQLLQGQMNNPYNQVSQQSAQYAQDQYYANSGAAQAAASRNWGDVHNQYNNANRSQQMIEGGLGKVQQSTTDLYNMAGASNQNYQGLMDYQKGQLGNIQQSQGNLYGAGNQILQTSQDPQNALYARTQQQLTDQSRAGQYARGIQSSPYGAALENVANQNFNIDWQNQQLGRQAQGLSAAQGAYGSAQGMGNSYTSTQAGLQAGQNEQYAGLTNAAQRQWTDYIGAANQSAAMGVQTTGASQNNAMNAGNYSAQQVTAGGQAQNNVYQNMYNQQNQALQNYQGNNQPYQQGLNQLQSNDLGYMNFGQGAQNLGWQQNMANNQQNQNNISAVAGPIGNAIKNTNWTNVGNTVGNWFGGSSVDSSSAYNSNDWFTS